MSCDPIHVHVQMSCDPIHVHVQLSCDPIHVHVQMSCDPIHVPDGMYTPDEDDLASMQTRTYPRERQRTSSVEISQDQKSCEHC